MSVFLQRPGLLYLTPSGPTQPTPLTSPPMGASYMYARDITNGWDLYTKSSDTQWGSNAAGSLTKFCSAIVLMDNKGDSLTETITVLAEDLVSGTSASLQADDVISYEDLLGGMLTISGNDASFAIAREIGTYIYTEAGSGTTGVVRFVEAMNDVATTLGLTNSVFTAPDGVNVSGNRGTAREWITLAEAAWDFPAVRAIANTASFEIVITGVNARTYNVRHTSPFIAGPFNTPSEEIGYDGVEASKTGSSGSSQYSVCVLFEFPNGTEIIIMVVQSSGNYDRYMDMSGVLLQIREDFPYLTEDDPAETDALWSSVTLLTGGDPGFIDESSVGRTLTAANGASRITDAIYGSHSYSFDGNNDHIHTPDAADLSMGSDEFIVECYYRGVGSEPALSVFVGKYDSGINHREWVIMYNPTVNSVFAWVSFSGSGYSEIPGFIITPTVFFNGALRHIALRRIGNVFSISVDGERSNTVFTSGGGSLYSGSAKTLIGARQNNTTGISYPMLGIIDEVRITKGSARSNLRKFTPSGKAYPRTGP